MRSTKASKAITTIFSEHPKPISAQELQKNLQMQHIGVNKTTIYRQLQTLIDQKVIKRVDFGDGIARFEATDETHHHHLICDNCGKVSEIALDESVILDQVARHSKFKVMDHSWEFFGLCSNCK